MSRIIVHIGTHKTATTHIQDMFHKNRAVLKRNGIVFPFIGYTRGQHGLASAWIRMSFPYAIRNAERVWKRLAKTYGPTDYTVFISSEELSRMRPSRVNMPELRSWLDGFDEVMVLCTLRNQASFLQSVYQQVSVERQPGGWVPYLERALETTMVDGLALDYNVLLRHVRQGFSADEVRFLSYDGAAAEDGGIIGAVLREIGAPLRADDLVPFAERSSNVSPPALATFAANGIAAPEVARARLVGMMSASIDAVVGAGQKTTIFSRPELNRTREVFEPLNRRFERTVSEQQPNFRIGPMLSGGRLAYRGRLNEDFWIDACRRLRAAG